METEEIGEKSFLVIRYQHRNGQERVCTQEITPWTEVTPAGWVRDTSGKILGRGYTMPLEKLEGMVATIHDDQDQDLPLLEGH